MGWWTLQLNVVSLFTLTLFRTLARTSNLHCRGSYVQIIVRSVKVVCTSKIQLILPIAILFLIRLLILLAFNFTLFYFSIAFSLFSYCCSFKLLSIIDLKVDISCLFIILGAIFDFFSTLISWIILNLFQNFCIICLLILLLYLLRLRYSTYLGSLSNELIFLRLSLRFRLSCSCRYSRYFILVLVLNIKLMI